MPSIAILGFNLFAPGGTTRSNLNLLHDFTAAGWQVSYINYLPATAKQQQALASQLPEKPVRWLPFKALRQPLGADVLMITRESFWPLARHIRQLNPHTLVVGEVHTPLALLDLPKLTPYLNDPSVLRVATPRIKQVLTNDYTAQAVYVQMVSLSHLAQVPFAPQVSKQDEQGVTQLHLVGRFDAQKDIPYALSLLQALDVRAPGQFALTITGYGPDGAALKKMATEMGIAARVQFNSPVPANVVALSTAKVESLGYTIAEALAAGEPVLAYPGDDGVVRENFADCDNILWLTKDVTQDVAAVLAFAQTPTTAAAAKHDRDWLMQVGQQYVATFSAQLPALQAMATPVRPPVSTWHGVLAATEQLTFGHALDWQHRLLYGLRRVPLFARFM